MELYCNNCCYWKGTSDTNREGTFHGNSWGWLSPGNWPLQRLVCGGSTHPTQKPLSETILGIEQAGCTGIWFVSLGRNLLGYSDLMSLLSCKAESIRKQHTTGKLAEVMQQILEPFWALAHSKYTLRTGNTTAASLKNQRTNQPKNSKKHKKKQT